MRIGVDLGGTKIEAVALAADGRVLERRRIPTESDRGYEHIVARTASLATEMCRRHGTPEVVGVGTPGAISSRTGRMKNCNTVCLNGRDLPRDLERAIGLPVRIENDANCFALAEARQGAGRGANVVFGVILGTGVGGGIVACGRLWRGPQHIAGEWGHHCVDPRGRRCYCGRRGCVERYLSGPALAESYRRRGGSALEPAQIVARARGGEARARQVMEEYWEVFGRALGNVISILDPDCVVLGGGLSQIPEMYEAGREAVAHHVFNDELRTRIVPAALGDSAGVIGAAWL